MTEDRVDYGGVEWSQDVGQAGWLAPRLAPFGSGLLTSVVPGGFEAYARVLHPIGDPRSGDRLVRWREVAAWSGLPLVPGAQFHEIALPEHEPPGPAPWSYGGPSTGTMSPGDTAVLAEVLAGVTITPGDCWFCLWDGYSMWSDQDHAALVATGHPGPVDPVPPSPAPPRTSTARLVSDSSVSDSSVSDSSVSDTAVSDTAVSDGPAAPGMATPHSAAPAPFPIPPRQDRLVELPGREYRLGRGPVTGAVAMAESLNQSPNLWWPADRAWCVATEIDLSWTYVGGPATGISRLVADPRIEAQPATTDESCYQRVTGWLAETINRAVASLLDSGAATVETSQGTVRATLRRPTRLQRGVLHTDYEDRDGRTGNATTMLRDRGEDRLRSEISHSLTHAVIDLVGG